MKISVCIPMYNEKGIIQTSLHTLSRYLETHFNDYEMIVCNDGSTDGSMELVSNLQLPHLKVIGYQENKGKGYAVRSAMLAASGDIRLFTDSDLAYGTDVIEAIYRKFEKDPALDLVIGSRAKHPDGYEGYTMIRKIASKVYIRLLGLLGGFTLSDSQCGCKAYSGNAAYRIFSRCTINGFSFDYETILWAVQMKMKIEELPVKVLHHGNSKVSLFRDSLKMLFDVIKMRRKIRAQMLSDQGQNKNF